MLYEHNNSFSIIASSLNHLRVHEPCEDTNTFTNVSEVYPCEDTNTFTNVSEDYTSKNKKENVNEIYVSSEKKK